MVGFADGEGDFFYNEDEVLANLDANGLERLNHLDSLLQVPHPFLSLIPSTSDPHCPLPPRPPPPTHPAPVVPSRWNKASCCRRCHAQQKSMVSWRMVDSTMRTMMRKRNRPLMG